VKAEIKLDTHIISVATKEHGFILDTTSGKYRAESLVIASGGLSIPKMCATPFGYQVAEQFGHHIWPTSAGLVPFTLQPEDKQMLESLSGISVESNVSNQRISFKENILFTHRGLSGPAVLQISSYWKPGEAITVDLLPDTELVSVIIERQASNANTLLKTLLNELLPKRLVTAFLDPDLLKKPLQELSKARIQQIADTFKKWQVKPGGTEGYRTAEVTLGGVDCDELSSKTMESKKHKGLYFIGEVVDVTGWLGGYNFQWAWSSGWCAGQVV
jgi:predicted Rossmann fold flavoprotein